MRLIFCSSIAAVFGPPGQSNHAAANSFLDSVCYYLRSQQNSVYTINWGAWSKVGYAARHGADKRTGALGVIEPEEGLTIFEWVVGHPQWTQTLVSPINWSRFKNEYPVMPAWLSRFDNVEYTAVADSQIIQQLALLSASERKIQLKKLLRTQVAQVLDIQDPIQIKDDVGFFEMGMDSLMSVDLRNRIQKQMGINFGSTFAFDNPTIERMADKILSMIAFEAIPIANPETSSHALDTPIAIIGMSCRFPGGANNTESFWDLLIEGRDGITPIPKDRWNNDLYFDPHPQAKNKMYVNEAGFLTIPVDEFDASFFKISPREAIKLDPQQRLLLELT